MKYILAHDLGTSGDKATLFTTDGVLFASCVQSYPCKYSNGNWAEQEPDDWYAAVCRATRELTGKVDPADIVGVSFSGHMMGAVLLDNHGTPLRSSIIWADQRATAEQRALAERVGDDRLYQIAGIRNNSTNSICKIMWVMAHDGIADRISVAINCKDYIVYRLTGNIGTDYSDASGTGAMDIHSFEWSKEVLDAAGVPERMMPEMQNSTDLAGHVTVEAARETGLVAGTPIFRGMGDGAAATGGAGVIHEGEGYISLGTSGWIAYMDDKPLLDPEKRTWNQVGIVKGSVYPLGAMQAVGTSYNWMRDQLCAAERAEADAAGRSIYGFINGKIDQTPVGANGVMFLPYLMGERSPWWDASARGAFLGIRQETRREDMLRAVVEGVSMNLALIFRVFQQQRSFESLRVIGGGAQDPVWRQILADILNVRIEKLNLLEEGCSLGAAVVAGIGAGVFEDASAISRFVHVDGASEPNPERVAQYAPMIDRFADAFQRLKGFY